MLDKSIKEAIIVMDKASYYSIQLEKIPTMNLRNAEIISWLTTRKIPHDRSLTRAKTIIDSKISDTQNKAV